MRRTNVGGANHPGHSQLAGALLVMLMASSAQAEDVLAKSRSKYAALKSYSDTGIVVTESSSSGGPKIIERHTFTTFYHSPRQYYFDFVKDPKVAKERLVVWGDGEAFHRWWSTVGSEDVYPRGQGTTAFALSGYQTKGSILQIAPFLFSQAGLQGTLTNFGDVEPAGFEDVDGAKCHKLVGVARDVYGATGKEVNVRRTTVWIDAQTLLLRRVLEDTPKGAVAGSVSRTITTFIPKANPSVDDKQFRFTVPSIQQ
jgi:outer membrane lipoprotein-sorting protein